MSDQDDWDESADEAVLLECDQCGEVKLCVKAQDPFLKEVYPPEYGEDDNEHPEEWWCRKCFEERADEI